jgi:ribosomal protein S18 acetylase RimI-like enzyme
MSAEELNNHFVRSKVQFRPATLDELPEIIELLADDPLGRLRETPSAAPDRQYLSAFQEIISSPHNELIVGNLDGKVIAVLQMTIIPNLSRRGTKRVLLEGVRVASDYRHKGIGQQLFRFCLDRAKSKDCKLAQLTTDKSRPEAFRFYERLGFKATHEGFKLPL